MVNLFTNKISDINKTLTFELALKQNTVIPKSGFSLMKNQARPLDKIESVDSKNESTLRSSYSSFENLEENKLQEEIYTPSKRKLMMRKKFGLA